MGIKTTFFGEVDATDGAIALMDGGTHGVQGHTITVASAADGRTAEWQRRLDGFRPSGTAGSGSFTLTEDERANVERWSDAAWALASRGHARFYGMPTAPPRWVWTIVMRRGAELRGLEGGAITWGDEPAELRAPLAWLRERVDALSAAPPIT